MLPGEKKFPHDYPENLRELAIRMGMERGKDPFA